MPVASEDCLDLERGLQQKQKVGLNARLHLSLAHDSQLIATRSNNTANHKKNSDDPTNDERVRSTLVVVVTVVMLLLCFSSAVIITDSRGDENAALSALGGVDDRGVSCLSTLFSAISLPSLRGKESWGDGNVIVTAAELLLEPGVKLLTISRVTLVLPLSGNTTTPVFL